MIRTTLGIMPPVVDQQHSNHARRPNSFDSLTAFIANQPGLAAELIRRHRDDGTNHCRLCGPGAQAGRDVWPCQIYTAAERATSAAIPWRSARDPQ
jgi:hypothetical protein